MNDKLSDAEICYMYEQIAIGSRTTYPSGIFKGKKPEERERIALSFFRVVIKDYIHWTPKEAFYQLNKDIIVNFKLKPLLRYINFSYEFNIDTDCHILVSKIFPTECEIDEIEETKRIYLKVLNRELSRYPKHFFEETDGERRALICLAFALNKYKTFSTPDELYQFIHTQGTEFFKKHRLSDAFKINFQFPIEYVHNMFSYREQIEYQPLYEKYLLLEEEAMNDETSN